MTVEVVYNLKTDVLPPDNSTIIVDDPEGVYAFVYHFTLSDVNARGYVRPLALSYVSPNRDKILRVFDEIRSEFVKVASFLQSCNWITFQNGLLSRMRNIRFTHYVVSHRLPSKMIENIKTFNKKQAEDNIFSLARVVPNKVFQIKENDEMVLNIVNPCYVSPLTEYLSYEQTANSSSSSVHFPQYQSSYDGDIHYKGPVMPTSWEELSDGNDLENLQVWEVLNELSDLDMRLRRLHHLRHDSLVAKGVALESVFGTDVGRSKHSKTRTSGRIQSIIQMLEPTLEREKGRYLRKVRKLKKEEMVNVLEQGGGDEGDGINSGEFTLDFSRFAKQYIVRDAKERKENEEELEYIFVEKGNILSPFNSIISDVGGVTTTLSPLENEKKYKNSEINDEDGLFLFLLADSILQSNTKKLSISSQQTPITSRSSALFPHNHVLSNILEPLFTEPTLLLPPSNYKNIQADRLLRPLCDIVDSKDHLLLFMSKLVLLHNHFAQPYFILSSMRLESVDLGNCGVVIGDETSFCSPSVSPSFSSSFCNNVITSSLFPFPAGALSVGNVLMGSAAVPSVLQDILQESVFRRVETERLRLLEEEEMKRGKVGSLFRGSASRNSESRTPTNMDVKKKKKKRSKKIMKKMDPNIHLNDEETKEEKDAALSESSTSSFLENLKYSLSGSFSFLHTTRFLRMLNSKFFSQLLTDNNNVPLRVVRQGNAFPLPPVASSPGYISKFRLYEQKKKGVTVVT
jgi:hypothetical protein